MIKQRKVLIILCVYTVIVALYSVYTRNIILRCAIEQNCKINNWDFFIDFISDPYLISYFVLPLFSIVLIFIVSSFMSENIMIRFDSLDKYIHWIEKNVLKVLFCMILIWYTIGFISSLRFGVRLYWSNFGSIFENTNYFIAINVFSSFFKSPVYAVIIQLFSFTLYMRIISIIVIYIHIQKKKMNVLIGLNIFFLLFNIVMFNLFDILVMSNKIRIILSFLLPSNYLASYNGIKHFNSPYFLLILLLTLNIIINFFGKCNWSKYCLIQYFNENIKKIILIILAISALGFNCFFYASKDMSYIDNFIAILYGITYSNGNITTITNYMIIYFGFCYLIILSLQKELSGLGQYKIIRYANIRKWFTKWFKNTVLRIIIYIFFLCFVSFVFAKVRSDNITVGSCISSKNTWKIIFIYYIISTLLQLIVYIQFIFIISWKNRNLINGLLGLMLLSIFMFKGVNKYYIVPVALNSIGIAVEHNIFICLSTLLAALSLQAFIIDSILNKFDI